MRPFFGAAALRSPGGFRIALGLAQGLALYLLYLTHENGVWPATSGFSFAPLLAVALLIPPLVLQSFGNVRTRTLTLWTIAATVLLAGVAVYEIWKSWPVDWVWDTGARGERQGHWAPVLIPSWPFFLAAVIALFISHSLVTAADADRQWIARYESYFDAAWKLALQLILSAAFVGVFWGVLFLGANLFELIDIDVFSDIIEESWFAIPVTTLATAVALHVSDVRSGIVRGMRTLVHSLLSWLLPLLALITVAFLATLPFTGLQALWDTRFASALLLLVSAALIVLINAAYKDGDPADAPPAIIRYAGSAAALALVPLALLCLVAVGLRVRQYGWTVDRIFASVLGAVALLYAGGYAAAAVWRGGWMKRIERWNIYAAFAVVAVILLLFSPLLDPARVSAASQLARLEQGRVTPEEFDYAYLRWQAGRFGHEALRRLRAEAEEAGRTAQRETIDKILASTNRYEAEIAQPRITAANRRANITVHPAGTVLPSAFLEQNWTEDRSVVLPPCLRLRNVACDAFRIDLNSDSVPEIIVADAQIRIVAMWSGDGTWRVIGTLGPVGACPGFLEAMRRQDYAVSFPPWREIEAGGKRLGIIPSPQWRGPDC